MLAKNSSHRRFNPLTGDWILVSPHRTQRPWRGQIEASAKIDLPDYDRDCYLCPGNLRAGGLKNPDYSSTYVFDNDFPALLPEDKGITSSRHEDNFKATQSSASPLFRSERETGICRVVCFSPIHNASIPQLPLHEIESVIQTWVEQMHDLQRYEFIHHIQIFENKGAMMGASNPHPHCQIWATKHIPNEAAKELRAQQDYHNRNGDCLLCDYLREEKSKNERIILEDEYFTLLVPYWAIWPYETMILANRHTSTLIDLNLPEISSLASILRRLTTRYDNLFQTPFPYSMGFHQSPVNAAPNDASHLHAHFYPPLLRSASVRKFMVGYEMLASPQRDLTPERAAAQLGALGDKHYLDSN